MVYSDPNLDPFCPILNGCESHSSFSIFCDKALQIKNKICVDLQLCVFSPDGDENPGQMDYDAEAEEDEDARAEVNASQNQPQQQQPQNTQRMGNRITFDASLPGSHSVSFKCPSVPTVQSFGL